MLWLSSRPVNVYDEVTLVASRNECGALQFLSSILLVPINAGLVRLAEPAHRGSTMTAAEVFFIIVALLILLVIGNILFAKLAERRQQRQSPSSSGPLR
jgi:hypothetical protein